MPVVTTRQLLEAGVHFGHQTRRWNPKMKRFIFTERNGIYILDLQQTVRGIEDAYRFTRDLVAGGGTILFVATKRQVQDAVQEQAVRSGMPYVNFRWLGGMLTNFRTMHERIKRMRELEDMVTTGSIDALPKKEALKLRRQLEKLDRNLGGLRDVNKAPDAVFILDTKKEEIAVREAKKLGIPIVAVLDTNSDPDDADYGIPGNDDAIRSGALLTRIIADAVIEGRSMRPPDPNAESKPEATPTADVLPGAAAEPKAEWELQLEAEMAAETTGGESRVLDATTPTPDPAAGDPGTSTTPDPVPEPVKDEPGDASHPSPKPEDR
jgi:small subunit ribosomal protein S2